MPSTAVSIFRLAGTPRAAFLLRNLDAKGFCLLRDLPEVPLERHVPPMLAEPIRYSPELPGSVADLVQSVKAQRLEGLISKRRDSVYEAGQRTGAWRKLRINQAQEFVIGGYTVGGSTFDALVFGYYEGRDLIYVARTRNGFTSRLREDLMKSFRPLESPECPFTNLPEARGGRWGGGLTETKMKDCRWLMPKLVGQFEYVNGHPTITCSTRDSSACAMTGGRGMSFGRTNPFPARSGNRHFDGDRVSMQDSI